MEMPDKLKETREALDYHRSLPLYHRIGRRIIGHYPNEEDIKTLERYEMSPYRRITEDTLQALRATEKLAQASESHPDIKWQIVRDEAKTVLMDIEPGSDNAKTIAGLFKKLAVSGGKRTPEEKLRVGLFVPSSTYLLAAAMIDSAGVGVYLESNTRSPMERVFPRQSFESLPEAIQQGFEQLVSSVELHAYSLYENGKSNNGIS